MLEKIGMIMGSSAVFGFFGYMGNSIRTGHSLDVQPNAIGLLARGMNLLIDTFGYTPIGLGLMGLSLFGGIYAAISLWRSEMY